MQARKVVLAALAFMALVAPKAWGNVHDWEYYPGDYEPVLPIDLNGIGLSVAGNLNLQDANTSITNGGSLIAGSLSSDGTRLYLGSGSVTITDGGLTIGSGQPMGPTVSVDSASSISTYLPLTVAGDGTLVNNGSVAAPVLDIKVGGAVSGSGAFTCDITNAGMVNLTGVALGGSYSGATGSTTSVGGTTTAAGSFTFAPGSVFNVSGIFRATGGAKISIGGTATFDANWYIYDANTSFDPGSTVTNNEYFVATPGSLTAINGSFINHGTFIADKVTIGGSGSLDLGGTNGSVSGPVVIAAGGSMTNGLLTTTSELNAAFTVQSGLIGASLAGAGGLLKTGPGEVTLPAASSYSGPTVVDNGVLNVTGSLLHNDSGHVFVAVDPAFANVIDRAVSSGSSFAGLGSSALGVQGTTADILASESPTSATTVSMSWRKPTADETTASPSGSYLSGEVLNLTGIDAEGQAGPAFVLQMSYDPTQFSSDAAAAQAAEAGLIYLGTQAADGNWENAVLGNFAGTDTFAGVSSWESYYAANGDPALSDLLGSWGVNTSNDTVWAVLDHNTLYAVVSPEPATLTLLAAGAVAMLRRRRRA